MSEPQRGTLADAVKSLKQGVSRRLIGDAQLSPLRDGLRGASGNRIGVDSKDSRTRGGAAVPSKGTAPLKPKPGLNGPPVLLFSPALACGLYSILFEPRKRPAFAGIALASVAVVLTLRESLVLLDSLLLLPFLFLGVMGVVKFLRGEPTGLTHVQTVSWR